MERILTQVVNFVRHDVISTRVHRSWLRVHELTTWMERFFTGRELVNTSSRLERNAALDCWKFCNFPKIILTSSYAVYKTGLIVIVTVSLVSCLHWLQHCTLHYITLHKTFIVRNHTEMTNCALHSQQRGSDNIINKKCKVIKDGKMGQFINRQQYWRKSVSVTEYTHTVRTTPFSLRCLLKFRFKTNKVIGPWTRITENYFTALLADLAVVLMVRLFTNHSTHMCNNQSHFTVIITDQSQHTHIYTVTNRGSQCMQ